MYGIPHLLNSARWRSGNAAVCKTAMQGFDSPSRLIKQMLGQNPYTGVRFPPQTSKICQNDSEILMKKEFLKGPELSFWVYSVGQIRCVRKLTKRLCPYGGNPLNK